MNSKDFRQLMEDVARERDRAFVDEPHSFTKNILHWPYCSKCGLVKMRNEFSQWAQRVGCDYRKHPSFSHQRKKTGD